MTRVDNRAGLGRTPGEWRRASRPTLAVTAVIVSAAIPPFLVGALAPLIGRDVRFTATEVGVSIAAYYLVSGVLSPFGGRTVEHLGVARTLRLSCAITTLGLLVLAAAGSATHLIAVLGLLGIPNSFVQPAANAALAEVRSPRLQALVFGVVQASIPAATLTAGVMLGLAGTAGGWRWTVLAVACLPLAALRLTRLLPAATGAPGTTRAAGRRSAPDPVRRHVVRAPGRAALLTALVATGFLASTAATSLPSYVASTGLASGLAPGVVAGAQVLGSIACATTRIVVPLTVSHGSPLGRVAVIAGLQTIGIAGYACLASGTESGFLAGTVLAYAFGWGWNGLFNLVVVGVRPDGVAAATGLTQGGVFLGGVAGPLLFALVVARSGYAAAWWCAAGAALGAAAAAVLGVALMGRPARARTA